MKHIYCILICVIVMSLSASAQIQRTFYGCTFGENRDVIVERLKGEGYKVVEYDGYIVPRHKQDSKELCGVASAVEFLFDDTNIFIGIVAKFKGDDKTNAYHTIMRKYFTYHKLSIGDWHLFGDGETFIELYYQMHLDKIYLTARYLDSHRFTPTDKRWWDDL